MKKVAGPPKHQLGMLLGLYPSIFNIEGGNCGNSLAMCYWGDKAPYQKFGGQLPSLSLLPYVAASLLLPFSA